MPIRLLIMNYDEYGTMRCFAVSHLSSPKTILSTSFAQRQSWLQFTSDDFTPQFATFNPRLRSLYRHMIACSADHDSQPNAMNEERMCGSLRLSASTAWKSQIDVALYLRKLMAEKFKKTVFGAVSTVHLSSRAPQNHHYTGEKIIIFLLLSFFYHCTAQSIRNNGTSAIFFVHFVLPFRGTTNNDRTMRLSQPKWKSTSNWMALYFS